ncbi:unannotated protein [freshwater metagenome]|uniref:Unannotated protein n=1 Tax=freshwater metagenome TaxID=449393 RepID=A0A6J7PP06_9ZZZZ
MPQRARVGAAHIAVAHRPGQRPERFDDLHDIGVACGLCLQPRHHRLHDCRQIGQQRQVEHRDQIGQSGRCTGPFE